MKKQTRLDVQAAVKSFPTKHKEGFTPTEEKEICNILNVKYEWYSEALGVHTGMMAENGDYLTYHHDVELGLACAIEGRKQTAAEWD